MHDLAVVHHHDPVGQFQDLVEILGNQQHRRAAVARRHDTRAHFRHRLHVQPETRIGDDQQLHVPVQFARQHAALHVAAGQHPDRHFARRRAHAVGRDHALGAVRHRGPIQPGAMTFPAAAIEAAQVQIVGDRHARHAAVAERLLRQHPHAARLRLLALRGIALARHDHFARRRRALAAEHFGEFLLPVAGHAGDADDLARMHRQFGDIQTGAAGVTLGAQRLDQQAFLRATLAAPLHAGRRLWLADHHRRHVGRFQIRGAPLAGPAAAPQHRDLVGEFLHFLQLVGDDAHGDRAAMRQIAHQRQHFVGFPRRQHRGGFVQHQEPAL